MTYIFNPLLRSNLQKLQDVFKGQFILKLDDGTEVNLTDVLENINVELSEQKTTLTTKLDKQQGVDNFGKVLAVGRDGIALPASLYTEEGYQPFTKAEKKKLATLPTQYGIDVVGTTSGYLKSYQLYRMENGEKVFLGSKVDIPQDFFLKEVRKIVVSPESPVAGLADGTYFKFVFVVEGGAEEVSYQKIDSIVAPITSGDNHVALNEQYEVTVRGFLPIYYDFADVPDGEDVFQYLGEFDGEHHKGFFYERTEDGWKHLHVDSIVSTGKDVILSEDFNIPSQYILPAKGMTVDNAVGNLASYNKSNDKRITELELHQPTFNESKLFLHIVSVRVADNAQTLVYMTWIDDDKTSFKGQDIDKIRDRLKQSYIPVYHVGDNKESSINKVYYAVKVLGYEVLDHGVKIPKASFLYRQDNKAGYSNNAIVSFDNDTIIEIGAINSIVSGLVQVNSFSGYVPKKVGECVQYTGSGTDYEKYAFYYFDGTNWNKIAIGGKYKAGDNIEISDDGVISAKIDWLIIN